MRKKSKIRKPRGDFLDSKEVLLQRSAHPVLLFPFTHPARFISLRDEKEKEIGIVKDLDDLSREAKNLLKEKLAKRYLTAVIKDIIKITETFGNYRWEVITDRGEKEFYMKGRSENLTFINDFWIVLTDVENCRYEIRDLRTLPRRAKVELEKVI